MNENEKNLQVEEPTQQNPMQEDYLETIKNIKSNSVSKEKYNQALAENKKLLEALISGEQIVAANANKTDIDISKEAYGLLHGELNNLDYAKKALELREAIKEKDGIDIFAPTWQRDGEITENDIACAEEYAETLEQLIQDSNNDPKRFQALFEGSLVEPANSIMFKNRRR